MANFNRVLEELSSSFKVVDSFHDEEINEGVNFETLKGGLKKIGKDMYAQFVPGGFKTKSGKNGDLVVRVSKEGEAFRVDVKVGIWPWESIDNMVPFDSLQLAKAYVKKYIEAAKKENRVQNSVSKSRR